MRQTVENCLKKYILQDRSTYRTLCYENDGIYASVAKVVEVARPRIQLKTTPSALPDLFVEVLDKLVEYELVQYWHISIWKCTESIKKNLIGENGMYTKHIHLCTIWVFVWGGSYKFYILNTNLSQIFCVLCTYRFPNS